MSTGQYSGLFLPTQAMAREPRILFSSPKCLTPMGFDCEMGKKFALLHSPLCPPFPSTLVRFQSKPETSAFRFHKKMYSMVYFLYFIDS